MDVPTHLRWSSARASESLASFLQQSVDTELELSKLRSNEANRVEGMSEEDVAKLIAAVKQEMNAVIDAKDEALRASNATVATLTTTVSSLEDEIRKMRDGDASASLLAKIEELNGEVKQSKIDYARVESVLVETRTENEDLKGEVVILRNENGEYHKRILELTGEIERLKNAQADKSKQEGLLADMEKRWRKALEDQKNELTSQNKKAAAEYDQIIAALKAELAEARSLNEQVTQKCDKLLAAYNREKKGREAAEDNWKSDVASLNGKIDAMVVEHDERVGDLNDTIARLEEEIERLKANQKEVVPTGSKFAMFVDLKSQNKQLSKQLEKEKSRAIGAGGLANARRASRGSFSKETADGPAFNEGSDNGAQFVRSGSATAGQQGSRRKFPEEVSFNK
jgi:chromosome segregation ATPase